MFAFSYDSLGQADCLVFLCLRVTKEKEVSIWTDVMSLAYVISQWTTGTSHDVAVKGIHRGEGAMGQ